MDVEVKTFDDIVRETEPSNILKGSGRMFIQNKEVAEINELEIIVCNLKKVQASHQDQEEAWRKTAIITLKTGEVLTQTIRIANDTTYVKNYLKFGTFDLEMNIRGAPNLVQADNVRFEPSPRITDWSFPQKISYKEM